MADELPPIDKFVISGYSEEHPDFPIVIVVKDSRALGYTQPSLDATCPDSRFPAHKFVSVTPTSVDNRLIWTYLILPGPPVAASSGIDPEMNTPIVVTRQRKLVEDITEGSSIVGGKLVVVEAQGSDGVLAYEQITTIDPPEEDSFDNALLETRAMAFQWPARINIAQLDMYGTAIGYHRPAARLVEATIKTYWVISDTKPELEFDQIIGHTITINDVTYNDVLHDETTRYYLGLPVDIPATTPSYTEYEDDWVGEEKLIGGGVSAERYHKLWKIEGQFFIME